MVILASQSPRRKELLQKLNIPFTVRVADVDETLDKSLPLEKAVAQLSLRKAEGVSREKGDVVIAADTIVVLDDTVLGKPCDRADAKRMLRSLSGRTHRVMTGVTVLQDDKRLCHTEVTEVTFRPLTEEEIEAYAASGDCDDKAGSYGIQSGGTVFVEKINGDYFNVVGLPVCRLSLILKEFAV
jgi:septum formation protein